MISGESVSAGSILEVEYQQAATLINLGKAVEFKGEVEACEASLFPKRRLLKRRLPSQRPQLARGLRNEHRQHSQGNNSAHIHRE